MSYSPDEEIIDAEFVEVPLERAEPTDSAEVIDVVAEVAEEAIPDGEFTPPPIPPGQIQVPAEVAAAILESTEGDVLTNQFLIDFLNGLSAQKIAETAAQSENGTSDLDSTLKAYENLQHPVDQDDVTPRKAVRGWLAKFDISQTLMAAMATSFLVKEEGWDAMMLSPIYRDQGISPYIKGWQNKAMNKVFKRFNLYMVVACEKYDDGVWVFGFKRVDHPDMVIRIARQDDLDYETAAAMAFTTYLRKL
jgi:hypothetical protein